MRLRATTGTLTTMWKAPVVAIVILVAACSPSPDVTTTTAAETTTSTVAAPPTTREDTTTTTGSSTTTTTPATTTTSSTTTTSTVPPSTTTTVTAPEGNEPPSIEIVSPTHLSSHTASWDEARKDNGANVALSAVVSDPDGDDYAVRWSSSVQGGLGTGESIVAFISTGGYDASQPFITATATDEWGASTSVSVQIVVWIPSDT